MIFCLGQMFPNTVGEAGGRVRDVRDILEKQKGEGRMDGKARGKDGEIKELCSHGYKLSFPSSYRTLPTPFDDERISWKINCRWHRYIICAPTTKKPSTYIKEFS